MWRRVLSVVCLAVVIVSVGLCATAGCEPSKSPPPRQAILILLDAARPDRFSRYGYERATTPEMDRLAAHRIVFRWHFAQSTSTRLSVLSMMHSRYFCVPLFPNSAQVPFAELTNLFRRADDAQISFVKALEAAGFTTAALTAHLWTGEDTAFADEFMEMHDLTTRFQDRRRPYPDAKQVIDYAMGWIRKERKGDYFLYVHLMDTHFPHYFGADAQAFFGAPSYDSSHFSADGGPTIPAWRRALPTTDRRRRNAIRSRLAGPDVHRIRV